MSYGIRVRISTRITRLESVICGSDSAQVATVRAAIANIETGVYEFGGPWDCFSGSGIITDVPVGSGYTLLFYGHNEDGRTTYSGAELGISVSTGNNDIGTIETSQFVTVISFPADTSTNIDPDNATFIWDLFYSGI